MAEVPNSTLLILIIILGGAISISQFFPYKDEKFKSKFTESNAIMVLVTVIICYIIVIVFNLSPINSKLIDDVLVGLSALLATASAIKYINHEKEIYNKTEKKRILNAKLRFNIYIKDCQNALDDNKNFSEAENILSGIFLKESRNMLLSDKEVFTLVKDENMKLLFYNLRIFILASEKNPSNSDTLKTASENINHVILNINHDLDLIK